MFTASGLLVRFLKVFEKSNYQSVKVSVRFHAVEDMLTSRLCCPVGSLWVALRLVSPPDQVLILSSFLADLTKANGTYLIRVSAQKLPADRHSRSTPLTLVQI